LNGHVLFLYLEGQSLDLGPKLAISFVASILLLVTLVHNLAHFSLGLLLKYQGLILKHLNDYPGKVFLLIFTVKNKQLLLFEHYLQLFSLFIEFVRI
jgi:hypothetical protein